MKLSLRLFLPLIILFSGFSSSWGQIINTIAGNGTAGFSGDGGGALSASFNQCPHSVVDASGNIYVTDYQNNRIRKISTSGIISTIAGTGTIGLTGDGGPATAATLNHPNVIAIDAAGNIYFADEYNYVIRKISTTGIITTVAGTGASGYSGDGGAATLAKLSHATGVIVNTSGEVFIADYANQRVRKVSTAGIITTVVGTGVAGFSGDGGAATAAKIYQPVAMAFDAAGNLYVVDQLNNRIRKVTPAGIISTVVGSSSTPGYSGDGGMATAAVLHYPAGIVFDAAGNMFFCDSYNHIVRKVSTTGVITKYAGTATVSGFSGDGGAAIAAKFYECTGVVMDNAGNLIVSDFFNNRIRRIIISNSTPHFDSGVAAHTTLCQNSSATPVNVLLSSTDADVAQIETWSALILPTHGVVSGLSTTISSTGSAVMPAGVTYTPTFGYSGTDSFSVTISDGAATDTLVVYIAINPLPTAGLITGPTSVCAGSTITLSNGVSGGTWTSNSPLVASVGLVSGIVGGVTSGAAVISYTISNACGIATDTQAITVLPLPTAGTIVGLTTVCPGSMLTLTDAVTGGTWGSSNPSVATVGATSGIVGGVATGTAIISYSVTNACGTATDTQGVLVTLIPSAGVITGPTNVCEGSSISLFDAMPGGTWSGSAPGVATIAATTGVVSGASVGTAIMTYSVTSSCGTASTTLLVTVDPAPNAGSIVGVHNVCEGGSLTLTDAVVGGSWSCSSALITVGGSSGVVGGLTAGTAVVTYAVTNSCGTATDTQSVTVNPLPNSGTINGSSSTLCADATIALTNTVTGGTWSSSNTSVATIDNSSGQVHALSSGATTVTYTTAPSSFGCVNDVTWPLTIIAIGSFSPAATINAIKCNGDSNGGISMTIATGIGPYQYIWSNGGVASSINSLAAGTYSVVVQDQGTHCVDTQYFNLVMPSAIGITSTVKNDFCDLSNGSIDASVTGGTAPYTFAWSNNANTEDVAGLPAGSYIITVTDAHLCVAQQAITVDEDSCNTIVIHDVITPNGDGINDIWVIEGLSKYPNNTVSLFDKWGDAVFSASNYNNDWSGEGKSGKLLPDGTYFYLLKLNAENLIGGQHVFTGSFLIKR